jgi:cell division protein FtsX
VAALRQIPGVERVHEVEPDEALARLRASADSLGGAPALAGIEPGFLPRSVEVAVAAGPEMPARTAELAARLRKLPGVVEVDAMSTGLARLLSWMALGRRLGLAALALGALAGAAALALALGWGRARRRREAEVLALLGETPSGARRAASMAAAAAALVGAAVGVAVLVMVFPGIVRAVQGTIGLGPLPALPSLRAGEVAVALLAALGLGWLGGYVGMPRVREGHR